MSGARWSEDQRSRAMRGHLAQALASDSCRAGLAAAKGLGGPGELPHLVELAVQHGSKRLVRALLDAGWPVERPRPGGANALRLACAQRQGSDLFSLLLDRGADPLGEDSDGRGPLGYCALMGQVDRIAELLSRPSAKDRQGALDRALMEACGMPTHSAARGCLALEEAGADWRAMAKSERGPVNCAQKAALCGPLEDLAGSRAFAIALSSRHPPFKGRGEWGDWRALDLPPERAAWIERALFAAEAADAPAPARGKPLRV